MPLRSCGSTCSGGSSAVRGDTPIPEHAWRRRRPADLLLLVAISPDRSLPREEVIATLWPDKDAASGANNLHRALYDLRQILGGRWLDIERGQLSLQGDVWLDVDAFERAAAAGTHERLAEAVALYRGDLVADSPEPRAPHPPPPAARSARTMPPAEEATRAGDAAIAVPLLRRILDLEPRREGAHRELMRLLALTGRRVEALRAYDACEGALRLAGQVPAEETRALRQAIQAGTLGPAQERLALDGARRAARRLQSTSSRALRPRTGGGSVGAQEARAARRAPSRAVVLGRPDRVRLDRLAQGADLGGRTRRRPRRARPRRRRTRGAPRRAARPWPGCA